MILKKRKKIGVISLLEESFFVIENFFEIVWEFFFKFFILLSTLYKG